MAHQDRNEFIFRVIVSLAKEYYYSKQIHYYSEELLRSVKGPELEDARCLLRMAFKEIAEHNSKQRTKITLLENLRYTTKYMQSTLFSGVNIPLRRIEKLIDDNPDKASYEIARMLNA